jgi:alpha/beta superfamily hydrolase
MSDNVVSSVSRVLSELGFRTVRFNSRGIGASQGKGSWTGETEAADYLVSGKGQSGRRSPLNKTLTCLALFVGRQ